MVVLLTCETCKKPGIDKVLSLSRNLPQNAISAASTLAMCFADRPP